MCFSAGASFGASALLGVIGAVTITKAKTIPQRLFATIPLVFAVQQLSEGMLWLSLKNPALEAGQSFFTYTFLFFAMMLWPVWIPFTVGLLEKNEKKKRVIKILSGIGVLVFIGIGCVLILYPVQVVATHHHIHYRFDFPPAIKNLIWLFDLLYFIATILTPFISGIKRMKWLGIIFLASYLFAVIFYKGFVVSVWCYFAAILSVVVLWILAGMQRPMAQNYTFPSRSGLTQTS
ncbi:MAG: DUF6629 family protein [Chitinophagaceae bacterium]